MKNLSKKVLTSLLLAMLLVAALVLSACNDKKPTELPESPTLALDKATATIQVGEADEIMADLKNFDENTSVIFASSDTTVLAVKQAGKKATVTAKKIGTASVTVTAGELTKTCKYTIVKADTIMLDKDVVYMQDSENSLWPGQNVSATYDSAKTDVAIKFTSSDESVVKVKSVSNPVAETVPEGAAPTTNKVVTAQLVGVGAGEAVIKATIGNKTKECRIQVSNYGIRYWYLGNPGAIVAYVHSIKEGMSVSGAVYLSDYVYLEFDPPFNTNNQWAPLSSIIDGTKTSEVTETENPNRLPVSSVFFGNKNITSVYFGKNFLSTGMGSFYNSGIKKVTFHPDAVIKTLGDWCFAGTKITECIIPNNATDGWYGRGVFANCTELVKVQLPDAYDALRIHLFYNCSKLDELYLPSALLKGIFTNAFGHDSNVSAAPLTKLYFSGTKEQFATLIARADVVANGNSLLLNYDKTKIFYGSSGLNTGKQG